MYYDDYSSDSDSDSGTNHRNHQPHRESNHNDASIIRKIGFNRLKDLNNMLPDEILIELISLKPTLKKLDCTGDSLVLLIGSLSKMCSCNTDLLSANKTAILKLINSEHFHLLLRQFMQMMSDIGVHMKKRYLYFWNDVEAFFSNVNTIFNLLLETKSTSTDFVQTVYVFNTALQRFYDQDLISYEIKRNFEKLCAILQRNSIQLCWNRLNISGIKTTSNNFRGLSVYPTSEELSSNVPVQKNLIDGKYDSVEHYLDIQFRLLKEDFAAPLRESISEYLKDRNFSEDSKKFSDIRIHRNVQFIAPNYAKEQLGLILELTVSDNKEKQDNAERFKYGSLVGLTKNFKDVIFARVISGDASNGQIIVELAPKSEEFTYWSPYFMIECRVYFEPYFRVLTALQNIDESNFPMKKYLIDLHPLAGKPAYLLKMGVYKIGNVPVDANCLRLRPTAAQLGLNQSQHDAFVAGLTSEFAVIQGPPGTGKTYVGLKITKTLLENNIAWHKSSPMLVVCYTNHALDQFLEGVTSVTDSVVRIGERSKNKNLEKFNIKVIRKSCVGKNGPAQYKALNKSLYTLHKELDEIISQIKLCCDQLGKMSKPNNITNFRLFANIEPAYSGSWFGKASNNQIIDWLFGGWSFGGAPVIDSPANKTLHAQELADITENYCNTTVPMMSLSHGKLYKPNLEIEETVQLDPKGKNNLLITTENMKTKLNKIKSELHSLKSDKKDVLKKAELSHLALKIEKNLSSMQINFKKYRIILVQKPILCDLIYPHNMSSDDRWRLYFYWLAVYRQYLLGKINKLELEFRERYAVFKEVQDLRDIKIMQSKLVVGMTTTGAARLQNVLKHLRSPIVIIEEAAEVLESHIVVSLTKNSQHVILIGDHQQLRPSTASYEMEVKYDLGISLFERMVRNKIQYYTLGVQHRMRPEIAKLIVPAIYSNLQNHPSVEKFPLVNGIRSVVYFINHENPEVEVGHSKANIYEAKYLISLAQYLIYNGYQPKDVTILAAYSAQVLELLKRQKSCSDILGDMQITTLDNYQGEESKIILLSLVRNNNKGQIGFLKVENRVCVALSRAREGLYIMGNMRMLCRASNIWPKINAALESMNSIGAFLPLGCPRHATNLMQAKSPKDFDKHRNKVCNEPCNARLICGHICPQRCHSNDTAHIKYQCDKKCERSARGCLAAEKHKCNRLCYEQCQLCIVKVTKNRHCGHKVETECSTPSENVTCRSPCRKIFECGHMCLNPCYISCSGYMCHCRTRSYFSYAANATPVRSQSESGWKCNIL